MQADLLATLQFGAYLEVNGGAYNSVGVIPTDSPTETLEADVGGSRLMLPVVGCLAPALRQSVKLGKAEAVGPRSGGCYIL